MPALADNTIVVNRMCEHTTVNTQEADMADATAADPQAGALQAAVRENRVLAAQVWCYCGICLISHLFSVGCTYDLDGFPALRCPRALAESFCQSQLVFKS